MKSSEPAWISRLIGLYDKAKKGQPKSSAKKAEDSRGGDDVH